MIIAHRHGGLRSFVLAGGALTALLASGTAMAITLAFSGSGLVTGPAQTPPVLTGLALSAATSNFSIDGDTTWKVDKLFFFDTALLSGGGTFNFSNGTSSFGGTFVSARASTTAPTTLTYTVTGGTGAYAGYTGIGFGFGTTIGNPFALPNAVVSFTEGGFFNISPVPEPSSLLLLSLGLTSAALWRRRQPAVASLTG
jgi:hypothetical protein